MCGAIPRNHLITLPSICTNIHNISRLIVLKVERQFWDTLVEMHEVIEFMKESKFDVLQGQLDKFKMKDDEGVVEMYSRLALITNEFPA